MQQSMLLQDFIFTTLKTYIYNKINAHYLKTEKKQVKKRVTPEFGEY
jgi:hypothetical protein